MTSSDLSGHLSNVREEQLGKILGDYTDRVNAGEHVEVDDILKAHPELAADLVVAFEGLEATADLQEIAYNRCLIQTKSNALYDVRAVAGQIPSAPDPLKHAYFVGMLLLEGGEIHLAVDFLTPCATEVSPLREKALNLASLPANLRTPESMAAPSAASLSRTGWRSPV